jgi:hypothetical protein
MKNGSPRIEDPAPRPGALAIGSTVRRVEVGDQK